MTRRELCGVLLDDSKWSDTWAALRDPSCTIATLRVSHATPAQLSETCTALCSNSSTRDLQLAGAVPTEACGALAELLQTTTTLLRLTITGQLGSSEGTPCATAAAAGGWRQVFRSLAAANTSITSLTLHDLRPQQLQPLADGLAARPPAALLLHLQLPGAQVDVQGSAALRQALGRLPHLESLSLSKAVFTCGGAAGAGNLGGCACAELFAAGARPETTASGSSPRAIDLSGAACGCCAAGSGGSSCSTASLCEAALQALGGWVASAPHLQQLSLAGCCQSSAGLTQLAAGLEATHPGHTAAAAGLRSLNLSSNSACAEDAGAGSCWQDVGRGLGHACSHLAVLHLGSCALGSDGLMQLARGLVAGSSSSSGSGMRLQELHLSSNSLCEAAGLELLLNSPVGASLHSLDLSTNQLSCAAVSQLSGAAGSLGLRHLLLGANWIGDKGAAALAGLLSRPGCRLATLALQHNRMHRAGIECLADAALAQGSVLHALQLQGNRACGPLTQLLLQDVRAALAQRQRSAAAAAAAASLPGQPDRIEACAAATPSPPPSSSSCSGLAVAAGKRAFSFDQWCADEGSVVVGDAIAAGAGSWLADDDDGSDGRAGLTLLPWGVACGVGCTTTNSVRVSSLSGWMSGTSAPSSPSAAPSSLEGPDGLLLLPGVVVGCRAPSTNSSRRLRVFGSVWSRSSSTSSSSGGGGSSSGGSSSPSAEAALKRHLGRKLRLSSLTVRPCRSQAALHHHDGSGRSSSSSGDGSSGSSSSSPRVQAGDATLQPTALPFHTAPPASRLCVVTTHSSSSST